MTIRRFMPPSSGGAPLLIDPAAASLPELERLGRTLRQAREAQGLSAGDLAARLNMGIEQLEALENGNRERLREAVFVIAQARRIAGSLGVNVDADIEALRSNPSFLRSRSDAPPRSPAPAPRPATGSPGADDPPPRPLRVVPALAAVAVVAGIAAAAAALQRGQLPWGLPQLQLPQLQSLLGRPNPPRPAPATPPRSAATPAATGSTPPAIGASLLLAARGLSWVEVTTLEGSTLFRGNLQGQKRFPLGSGLRVLAGRPDLVSVQVGTGAARVLGPIDAVVWRRFSPDPTAPAP